jgi:hypothetical protein
MHHCGGDAMKCKHCKIKVTKEILDIFPKYRPQVGQVYEAVVSPGKLKRVGADSHHGKAEFCVIDVLDKRIALRKGEYEIV